MEIKDVIAAMALLLTVGNLFWTRHVSSQDKSKSAVDKLKDDLQNQKLLIDHVKTQMQALPSMESFHKLELAVTEVKGSMNTMAEKITPIKTGLDRIEKWLIDNSATQRKPR
jgi:Protein of unknown function (DUF2730)